MAISKVTLKLPSTSDPPDITVINTALKQLQDSLNQTIDEVNAAVKFVSDTDDYVEVKY
ncbi:hypothetical protein [Longibaculum muris]|uniref:hypothetical protein n=1 Tax=Longibaculum muris TaxID=1796628 RepID=UPI0022E7F8DF|nr:hypothetical protein [Longibaculum muris]